MPPSEPTLFDDDDAGVSTAPASPRSADPDIAADPDRSRPSRGGRPNYLIRRGVVVGGVVAVIATAAIVIGNLIGTGATDDVSGAVDADWNRVIRIDERAGLVIVHDDNGDELERIESGVSRATDSAVVGPTAVLVADDDASVIDLDDATVTDLDLGGSIARPSGSAFTIVVTDAARGRGILVHTPTGELIDSEEFAPLLGTRYEFDAARATPSGRDVLVTDSGNFQSVLFSFDRDEPSFFPGLALAVTDDVVVTAQNVGTDATVNVFDHEGEPISSGRTASVRAAIVDGDTVRLVTVDGRIVDLSIGSGDTDDGDLLDIGTIADGHVWTSGDRLVVTGAGGSAVVAADGSVVTSLDDAVPVDDDALFRSSCLVTRPAGGGAAGATIVDVGDGTVVAESDVDGVVFGTADGCTILTDTGLTGTTGGAELLDASGATTIDAGTVVALAPDGAAFVEEAEGRTNLRPTTGDDGQTDDNDDDAAADGTVDLGPDGRRVAFTGW